MSRLADTIATLIHIRDDINYRLAALGVPVEEPAEDTCPCGHTDYEHVHYCSADVVEGMCHCNEEYRRV